MNIYNYLELIGGSILILSFLWGVMKWIIGHNQKKIKVIRIHRSDEKDFIEFCELLKQGIRLELRENPYEVGDWLDDFDDNKDNNPSLYEYLFAAKYENEIIGGLFLEHSVKSNFLYIDFLVKKENGKEVDKKYPIVSFPLAKKCYEIVKTFKNECRLIIFEVDNENDERLNIEQRDDAITKKKLFGSFLLNVGKIKKLNVKAYQICIDYYQPPLHGDYQNKIKQDLVIIPLKCIAVSEDMTINKQQLGEILHFLYFDVYDTLSADEQHYGNNFHKKLVNDYNELLNNIPEMIRLNLLTRIPKKHYSVFMRVMRRIWFFEKK